MIHGTDTKGSNYERCLLALFLYNREVLMSEVVTSGRLGHSHHEGIKFKISDDRRKSASKMSTLDKRRADCSGN